MPTKSKREMPRGFTLVELLIVVAIIGVLSTIGVPTYRKMIEKARQAEAKQALGAIHSVQRGFFAEWETYTSNIYRAGFEIPGGTKYYYVGFDPWGQCNTGATYPHNATPLPPGGGGTEVGQRINSEWPEFYAPTPASNGPGNQTFAWGMLPVRADGNYYSDMTVCYFQGINILTQGSGMVDGTTGVFAPRSATVRASGYQAIAAGVIRQGLTPSDAALGTTDVWTVNDNLTLSHQK